MTTQPRTRPARPGAANGSKKRERAAPNVLVIPPLEAQPPGVPHVLAAISHIMRVVGPVGKDSFNEQQRFNFRGIEAVVNALQPWLAEQGIITIPRVTGRTYEQVRIGSNGTLTGHAIVDVTYTFVSSIDGSREEAAVYGEAMDVGDKALSKAQSVAWRTALIQMFSLATSDPDPDHSVYERTSACEQRPDTEPQQMASRGRQGGQQAAKPAAPTADQLSRWQGQLWDVGADGIYQIATEMKVAGAWEINSPGKTDYPMWQEVVDRVACLAMASDTTTREQIRELRQLSEKIKILGGMVSSSNGPAPRLADVLVEADEAVARRIREEAAATEHGQETVAKAADSWQDAP